MKKTWAINNGWNRLNAYGQMVLREIGPREFDPDYEDRTGYEKPPYRFVRGQYVFARKRDWAAAVERLQEQGFN